MKPPSRPCLPFGDYRLREDFSSNGPWYFSHAGVTYGPFSLDEIKDRSNRKMLSHSDWAWQDAADAKRRVADLLASAVAAPAPDWLADVVEAEKETESSSTAAPDAPDWLEDLRLWIALEQFEPGWEAFRRTADRPPSTPAQGAGIPDWLAGWNVPGGPKESTAVAPANLASPASAPVVPAIGPAILPPAKPRIDAPPLPNLPKPVASPVATPATEVPQVLKVPQPPPKKPKPVVQERAKTPAEQMLEVSGFDSETGQILHADKFRRWKQQQATASAASAASQPVVSNASLLEVFRKGRTAIETWVDDEASRLCVLHAEPDEIMRHRNVQAILDDYANYGSELREKLLLHLKFMVNDRREYYQALEVRG